MHTNTHARTHARTHAYTHTHARTHAHTRTHARTHADKHSHTHAHIETNRVAFTYQGTRAHGRCPSRLLIQSLLSLRSWDIAQLVPVDRVSPSETFDGLVKGMRIAFYIFLFLVILISGAFSIVSLLWLERLAGQYMVRIIAYTDHSDKPSLPLNGIYEGIIYPREYRNILCSLMFGKCIGTNN